MLHRLRLALLTVVALVAAGLFSVTTTAPAAHAAEDLTGTTCLDPHISGTFTKLPQPRGALFTQAEFTATGFTSANCPTLFTDYRYKVAFTYNGQTVSSYHAAIKPIYNINGVRQGTRIEFPAQRVFFSGFTAVDLAFTGGSKSVFTSTWCRSNEQTWDYGWLWPSGSHSFAYDTAPADGVPRARINACP